MKRLLAMFCTFGASSALAAMFFELGPSKVIYPEQDIPLIFDHAQHLRPKTVRDGPGLECEDCHRDIAESRLGSDRHIPGHPVCERCHGEWIGDEKNPAPRSDCARCHGDVDPSGEGPVTPAPMRIPPPNIHFSHQRHADSGAECLDCHPEVPRKGLAVRDDYPTMDRCLDCHQKTGAKTTCPTCHLTGANGKIVQRFSSGVLVPGRYHAFAIHDANFLRDHAVPGKRERAYCASCHTDSECMACHDGIGRDHRYHPDAWMAQHSLRARKDDHRCQSCHRLQSFCLSCHIRTGVASAGPVADPLERRTFRLADPNDAQSPAVGPHPMGPEWINPGSRSFHGFHAQRNIRACAACHQENFCVQCHGSGFGGRNLPNRSVNPHGPNPERLRGSLASRQNARACLKCHSPADPSWR